MPYFISRIEDSCGKVVFEAKPKLACPECEQPAAPLSGAAAVSATAGRKRWTARLPPAVAVNRRRPRRIHDVDAPRAAARARAACRVAWATCPPTASRRACSRRRTPG